MSRNRCETTCDCGLKLSYRPELSRRQESTLVDGKAYLKAIGWESCPYRPAGYGPGQYVTMFGKVVCPICRLEYAGWFAPPNDYEKKYEGPEWRLYDTSFWSTFNDEAGDEDKKNWRDPLEVLAIIRDMK